jgi:hypothetical protein
VEEAAEYSRLKEAARKERWQAHKLHGKLLYANRHALKPLLDLCSGLVGGLAKKVVERERRGISGVSGIGQAVVRLPKDRDDFRVLFLLPSIVSICLAVNFEHDFETYFPLTSFRDLYLPPPEINVQTSQLSQADAGTVDARELSRFKDSMKIGPEVNCVCCLEQVHATLLAYFTFQLHTIRNTIICIHTLTRTGQPARLACDLRAPHVQGLLRRAAGDD